MTMGRGGYNTPSEGSKLEPSSPSICALVDSALIQGRGGYNDIHDGK